MFDTCYTLDVSCLCQTVYITSLANVKRRSPEVLPTPTGPLTTNDRISIEVAVLNHTQTRPKYQYRFLALHRSDRSAALCRLSVEAFTEKEARQVLSAHFILSLAARLPVREVCHA
nr:host cell division inhibitor Icd-like protein [Yersinia kristensenii]